MIVQRTPLWFIIQYFFSDLSKAIESMRFSLIIVPDLVFWLMIFNYYMASSWQRIGYVISFRSHWAWYVWHWSIIRFPFIGNCMVHLLSFIHPASIAVMYRHYVVPRLSSRSTPHTHTPFSNSIFYVEHTVVAATWKNACKQKVS